jgi:hypothetical protein
MSMPEHAREAICTNTVAEMELQFSTNVLVHANTRNCGKPSNSSQMSTSPQLSQQPLALPVQTSCATNKGYTKKVLLELLLPD